jgi:hypothetical protein
VAAPAARMADPDNAAATLRRAVRFAGRPAGWVGRRLPSDGFLWLIG